MLEFGPRLIHNVFMMEGSFSEKLNRWLLTGVTVGRIRGIEINLHVTLLLTGVLWILPALVAPDIPVALAHSAALIFTVFGSVLLHELGHCYGAHLVGGRSESIVLWPLGGLALTRDTQSTPSDEFLVVLLGPLVSLAIALAATLAHFALPQAILGEYMAGRIALTGVATLMWVNWMLFVFNMVVPLFPMDCARLIRAHFSANHNPQKITYNVCLVGIFTAGMMTCLSVVAAFIPLPLIGADGQVFFILIAGFGVFSCLNEMRQIEYADVYSGFWTDGSPIKDSWARLVQALRAMRKRAPIEVIQGDAPPASPFATEKKRRAAIISLDGESTADSLEAELGEAIKAEDFIRAAEIRDLMRNPSTHSPKRS